MYLCVTKTVASDVFRRLREMKSFKMFFIQDRKNISLARQHIYYAKYYVCGEGVTAEGKMKWKGEKLKSVKGNRKNYIKNLFKCKVYALDK